MSSHALDSPAAVPNRSLVAYGSLAALVVLSLAPVALVEIPAMVDYPNHLARMSVLARAGTPDANPYYEVVWAAYPNLAMDIAVPWLARFAGIETATRVFYLASQLLLVSGAMAIGQAVRGRVVAAGVAACLVLYSAPFAFGFINYAFGQGLALWAIAAWIAIGPRRPALRFAMHAGSVLVLFAAHLFALGIYGFAIGVMELWRARRGGGGVPALAREFGLMALPVVLGAIALRMSGTTIGGDRTLLSLDGKLYWLFSLNGFSHPLSVVLVGVLATLGFIALCRGWLAWIGPGPWLAAGFAILYLLMPIRLLDTGFVDVRVPVAAELILPAFVAVAAPPGFGRRLAALAVAAVALVNLAMVAAVQIEYRPIYRTLVSALKALPKGSRVLVGSFGEVADPPPTLSDYPMYHAPVLAVLEAQGFVPTLFTYPGKQPVLPRATVWDIAAFEGRPVALADLEAIASGSSAPQAPRYVARWTRDFDYLCVIGPRTGDPLPGILTPLVSTARFTLYRIGTATPR